MRKLVVLKFCQVCWKEDRREVEAEFSETVNGKDLDLCEDHASIPIRLLVPTLAQYGTAPQAAPPAVKPPKEPKPPKENQATDSASPKGKFRCEVPGCNYGPKGGPHVSLSPQGRGAHMRTRHGVVGSSPSAKSARLAAAK